MGVFGKDPRKELDERLDKLYKKHARGCEGGACATEGPRRQCALAREIGEVEGLRNAAIDSSAARYDHSR